MRIRALSSSPMGFRRLVHDIYYSFGAECIFQLLDSCGSLVSKAAEILTTERQPLLVIDDSADFCLFEDREHGRSVAGALLGLLDDWPRVPVVIFTLCEFGRRLAVEAQSRRGHVLLFDEVAVSSTDEIAAQISNLWETMFGEPARSVRLEYFSLGAEPLSWLQRHPEEIQRLKPQAFEELLEDLFLARGYNVQRTGRANRADGGIDMVLTPEDPASIPYVIAVQAKHRSTKSKIGSVMVRELAGAVGALPVNIALLVSNAKFTTSAAWEAQRSKPLIRLVSLEQLKEWIAGNFVAGVDWAEIPRSIEVAPGHIIKVPMPTWLEQPKAGSGTERITPRSTGRKPRHSARFRR